MSSGPMLLFLLFAQAFAPSSCQETIGNLVLLKNNARGGLCLDGTPPGYWWRPATQSANATKWVVHLEGGGWCWNEDQCASRAKSSLGSSSSWGAETACYGSCDGILTANCTENPDFCGWNAVFVGYCDGSSFSGGRVGTHEGLYYRGRAILDAVFDSLLEQGMNASVDVVLTGGSAGGLSTYLQLDHVRTRVPATARLAGLADAGWFLDHATLTNQTVARDEFTYAYSLWNASGGVNDDCVASKAPADQWQCVFAQYTFPFIQTPIFIAEGAYDSWQLVNILQLGCGNPTPQQTCSAAQTQAFVAYGQTMRSTIAAALQANRFAGAFVSACIVHCQTVYNEGQDRWDWWQVDGLKVREVFRNWAFGTGPSRAIDQCDWPCNSFCPVWT